MVLGAVLVYAAVLAPSLGLDKLRADVLASLGYVVNWHFIFSGQSYFGAFTTPSPLLHLWSLAVEEQFYLIWPPVVLGTLWLARRRFQPRAAIATVGVVALGGAIASSLWMVALYQPGGDPSRVYYGTDTRAQAMLIGAVLAVVSTLHGPLRSRAGRAVLDHRRATLPVRGRRAVVRVGRHRGARLLLRAVRLFAYCVATAIVLWRLTQPRPGALGAALSWEPVRWVGAISYEMYLWHWPTYLVVTRDRTGLDGLPLLAVRLSDRGRARVGHRSPGRRPDPPRRAPAFAAPRAGHGRALRSSCHQRRGVRGDDRRAARAQRAGRTGCRPPRAPDAPGHLRCSRCSSWATRRRPPSRRASGPTPASTGSPPSPASRSGTGRFSDARS